MKSPVTAVSLSLLAGLAFALTGTLEAEERLPEMRTLQPGVKLSLVAEQPDVVTPIGVDVDEVGQVWLISSHTHFPRGDYEGPKHDEILVFDRQARRSVFYNATKHTMELEIGPEGWLYLAERDRILRVKDTDGDGRGDTEETIATLKTKGRYPHDGLAGLAWHPEGDLLFGFGENHSQPWTLTSTDGREFRGVGEGAIFRCRADGTEMRRIARGMWNPFGICARSDGEIFAVDNDPSERPPCRLLHVVEGADFGYQGAYGKEAHHPFVGWYGQLRGTLPMIHPAGEGACAVSPLGRGILLPSWSDHRIYFYPLIQQGASYTAAQLELVRGGRYFRPTCIARDNSSACEDTLTWYMTDWVDGRYEVHGYGRLWKLEIDRKEAASWLGPTELQSATPEAQLASDLRQGRREFGQEKLFQLANGEDRYVAQGALSALARDAQDWQPRMLADLEAKDRVQALLALRLRATQWEDRGLPSKPRPADSTWVERFLADPDPEVQFEALRWIADARMTRQLANVQRLLDHEDLSYRLFEAGIAAWNTLSGRPESGIRNVKMLLGRVRNRSAAPNVRAFALRLLPQQPLIASDVAVNSDVVVKIEQEFPAGLTLELFVELLAVGDPELSLEAIRTLSGSATAGQEILLETASDQHQSAELRAEAIVGLASITTKVLKPLLQLTLDERQPVREEALRALRGTTLLDSQQEILQKVARTFPDSADLVRAVLQPQQISAGRPEMADTGAWLSRLEGVPGEPNPAAGRRLFYHPRLATCASCHRNHGRGNVVGPDLSSVASKNDRRWLMESLLQPSLRMAPEYRPTVIYLEDGRSFTGIRLQSATFENLRDSNGQNRRFERSEIEEIRELDHSFMPDGLVNTLTDRELRDLLAYLEASD